jgi:hypothetical protein
MTEEAEHPGQLFELELLGGAVERRYRRMRPEVGRMPWGTLDLRGVSDEQKVLARKAWTSAAYQEHRTAAACAATLKALVEVQAPIDLIALASRFPLDEMVHVELCAKMAMEFGGGTEIRYEPTEMVVDSDPGRSPIERAGDVVVRFFCVGETLSIPLLRGTWKAAEQALPRAVLGRIVKDEAAHGVFGYWFLDWAADKLDDGSRAYLAQRANLAMGDIFQTWEHIAKNAPRKRVPGDALAWMGTEDYLRLAMRSMRDLVVQPLRERGILVRDVPEIRL